MTDDVKLFDYSKSPLSPYQQARAEALRTAAGVLSSSSGFMLGPTKNPPGNVDDLLRTSDWILGGDRPAFELPFAPEDLKGVGVKIDPENLPSLFELLGRISEDCGHPDCPIHAPTREAKDLDPENAKSSFDDGPAQAAKNPFVDPHEIWKKQHGHETPVDFTNVEQTGTAEASDFEGGWADTEDEEDHKYPPRVSANNYHAGTIMNDRKGDSWRVVRRPDGGVKWERVLAVSESDEEY